MNRLDRYKNKLSKLVGKRTWDSKVITSIEVDDDTYDTTFHFSDDEQYVIRSVSYELPKVLITGVASRFDGLALNPDDIEDKDKLADYLKSIYGKLINSCRIRQYLQHKAEEQIPKLRQKLERAESAADYYKNMDNRMLNTLCIGRSERIKCDPAEITDYLNRKYGVILLDSW